MLDKFAAELPRQYINAGVAGLVQRRAHGVGIVGRDVDHVLALLDQSDLRKVRSHASALKNNNGQIPAGRMEELTKTLQGFFRKDVITQDDINLAARINPGRRTYEAEAT